MTHGDKSKAKKTASKASASQKSKAVQAAKTVKNGKSSKAGKESGGKKAVEALPKAVQAIQKQGGAREKAAAAAKNGAVKAGPAAKGGSDAKLKARPPADPSGFTNPLVGAGFKRALKKYPNAFRRLTD